MTALVCLPWGAWVAPSKVKAVFHDGEMVMVLMDDDSYLKSPVYEGSKAVGIAKITALCINGEAEHVSDPFS